MKISGGICGQTAFCALRFWVRGRREGEEGGSEKDGRNGKEGRRIMYLE